MTRWGRGQKLIHGVRTVDLPGCVLAERDVIVKAEVLPAENQSGPGGGGSEGFDKCEGCFYRLKCNLISIHLLGSRNVARCRQILHAEMERDWFESRTGPAESGVVTPIYGQMSFLRKVAGVRLADCREQGTS